jgi:hypothetical protein
LMVESSFVLLGKSLEVYIGMVLELIWRVTSSDRGSCATQFADSLFLFLYLWSRT